MTKFVLAIEIEASTASQAESIASKIAKTLPEEARMRAIGLQTSWYDGNADRWVRSMENGWG